MSESHADTGLADTGRRESDAERNDRIYRSLPPLRSPEYLRLLKSASATELPAAVLVRAYRELHPSAEGDATLERLLGYDHKYRYLAVVTTAAHRRRRRLDGYTPEDLVQDTIGEINKTLAGPRGKEADRCWVSYLHHCMEDANRKLVGRRRRRLGRIVEMTSDDRRTGGDPIANAETDSIPWHGRVAPTELERLEPLVENALGQIADERVRAVGLAMLHGRTGGGAGDDSNDTETLARKYGVSPSTICQWRRRARAVANAAIRRQKDWAMDTSFLNTQPGGPDAKRRRN
jgi:transposase-like protein